MYKQYVMDIGLEVHVELATQSKIFCSCSTAFGAEANTQVCPVCLAMPGTLPVLNKQAVEYAIMAGLALDCSINLDTKLDRKHYTYPDLSKAYQISQYDLPVCYNGKLEIETDNGEKQIYIERIHLEEDAGKLIHDSKTGTLIDYNRSGVPLIELVTGPDFKSGQEVDAFLTKLRSILLNTGVSDCKMNEGSFRVDVNLSVRKSDSDKLGVRTEMKNLNSFAFIQKAIEYEFKRQVDSILAGKEIVQETRRYEEKSKKTFSMREKEDALDYRYMPDADLPKLRLSKTYVEQLKKDLPVLSVDKKPEIMKKYSLSSYDAAKLCEDLQICEYYEQAAEHTSAFKTLANLLIPIRQDMPKGQAVHFAAIAQMAEQEEINMSTAQKLCGQLVEEDFDPVMLVKEKQMQQVNDRNLLTQYIKEALAVHDKAEAAFKQGNKSALGPVIGFVMKKTRGFANPVIINELLDDIMS